MRSTLLALGPRKFPKAAWWLGHAKINSQHFQKHSLPVWQNVNRRLNGLIMAAMTHFDASDDGASIVRLAIIGDVHGDWDTVEDAEALCSLDCDAAVFVGDLNNEDVPLCRTIAAIQQPSKAVILGNHDAWSCLTDWRRKISSLPAASDSLYSGVEQQLDILGADHVGYALKRFTSSSGAPFAIVGARPFSKGGHRWADCKEFYMRFHKVSDTEASAKRIADTVLSLPKDTVPILAAHNGPTNLGSNPWSISGVDFKPGAGDHGDRDLELALQQIRAQGGNVPLVVFGHMHEKLRGTLKLRNMVEVDARTGTVYLNTAVVPRIRTKVISSQEVVARHFCVAELHHGVVQRISNVWMSRGEEGQYSASEEQVLLTRGTSTEGNLQLQWCRLWRGYTQDHEVIYME